jgi:hypothetical protein
MELSLRKGALALSFAGAAALLSAPALATDPAEQGYFGGTYRYIGPGAASLPPEPYVEFAPIYPAPIYPPPVYGYVAPEVVVGPPPVIDYDYGYVDPDAGVTFVEPDGGIAVGLD